MVRASLGDRALASLEVELLNEKMESLGRSGRGAQEALAKLAAFAGDADTREMLLDTAASKVWSYLVQRELCGFAHDATSIRDMDVPPEVTARLGVAGRKG